MIFNHKFEALYITNQQNILHNLLFTIFNYRLDSKYIDYVDSQTDLGITVNSKLLRKEHCAKLKNPALNLDYSCLHTILQ